LPPRGRASSCLGAPLRLNLRGVFLVDSASELDRVFGDIVEELSNQYLLSYASSNDKRDGTWRKITVDLTDKRYHVRHRQGYRAPGPKKK